MTGRARKPNKFTNIATEYSIEILEQIREREKKCHSQDISVSIFGT